LEQWRMMLRLVSTHASIPCPIDCATAGLWQIAAQRGAARRRGPMLTARRTLRPTPFLPILAVALALLGGGTWFWSLPATRQSTAAALGRIAWHSQSPLTRPRPLPSTHDLLAVNRQ